MKELVIAANMISLARSKSGNKRSAMLRMIMPFLSRATGDELAEAISKENSVKFARIWDKVKSEIQQKLDARKHVSTASACVCANGCMCKEAIPESVITDEKIIQVIKLVCEKLLMKVDPCPLPEQPKEHSPSFDMNANMLELYDRLTASAQQ